jgi:hypothetical protein
MQKEDAHRGSDLPTEDVLRRIRIPFVRRATVSYRGKTQDVFTIDVGLAGVFVESPEMLPIGEPVEVRFSLPSNEIPLVVQCRVAWRHEAGKALVSKYLPPGIGLEFKSLSRRDQIMIREHVEDHCRRHPTVRRFLRHWPEAERSGDDPGPRD